MISDTEKTRNEDALESLAAVLSAILVARRWLEYYPTPYPGVEEQSIDQIKTHLDKAESTIRNLANG